MKKKNLYLNVLIFIVFAFSSCNKEEVILQIPEVSTISVSDIAYQSATCCGYVTSTGAAITSRGICWSTKPTPTIADSISNAGDENVGFTIAINNLKPDSTYYIRAYATNSIGTGYGNIIKFKTKHASINVITAPLNDVSFQSATCGGSVTCEGTTITACGICWSTNPNPAPTHSDSITVDRNDAGSFTSEMKGLKPNLTYYVRSYAANGVDTIYGSTMKFKTKRASITVTTTQANTILQNSAICGGTYSTSGGVSIVLQGMCWSLSPYPTIEDYNTAFTSITNDFYVNLSKLQPNKLYYARSYAASYNELIYGENIVFKTRKTALFITAPTLRNITTTTVEYSGVVTSELPTAITARGVCWSTNSNPTISDNKSSDGIGNGTFTASVTGLKAGTTYFIRTYVTDNESTVYGDIVSFLTNVGPVVGAPIVKTLSIVKISTSDAKIQGQITSEGNSSVTSYGFYCSKSANPVESNSVIWGFDTGTTTAFSSTIIALTPGAQYYVRAFAKNSSGMGYGNVIKYVH